MGNGACTGKTSTVSRPGVTHVFYVTTGEKKKAGLNANVFARLGDEDGHWSEWRSIDSRMRNDFEKGNVDIFHLKIPEIRKAVTEIELRRDSSGANDEWYLERVKVKSVETGKKSYFPVNRWLHVNEHLKLSEYDSSLPLECKYTEQRKKELEMKRSLYRLVRKEPGIPAAVDQAPHDEVFNTDYEIFIGKTVIQLGIEAKIAEWFTGDFQSLKDFEKVYFLCKLVKPDGADKWKTDENFGRQRLTGVNPGMIQLCQEIPKRFSVTADMVEPFLEEKTLLECMNQKRIYIEDLSFLEGLVCPNGKPLCSPFGLFYVKDSGDLVPIAIQIEAKPGAYNPVFLPSDPEYTWLLAKMWLNLADASVHQSASHLGFTHLLMESVAVCANRQLSPSHPVFRLLAPHLRYLIAINSAALVQLTGVGAWVDQAMQIGRDGMFHIIRNRFTTWSVQEDGNLLKNLQKRGVDDEEALPNYHYRDDAKLLWNAIDLYVADVIDDVYDAEDKLLSDVELQNFAAELSSPNAANIKGVPRNFTSTADLKEVLTVFIFISSVQHAAVNFGQYDEYGFSPNYPASIRTDRPKTKAALSERDVVNALPNKEDMLKVILVTGLLSSKGTESLGYYEMEYALDPNSQKALKRFRANLKEAGKTIEERNSSRTHPYPYLHPREVPNAISI